MSRTAPAIRPWNQGPPPPRPSPASLWFAAIKPPMYTVAITPILVGSISARAETAFLSSSTLLLFLLSAILIIAWLNITNDVFDFDLSFEASKPESIVNLCGATRLARNFLLLFATSLLVLAFYFLNKLSTTAGRFDPTVPALITLAVVGGYAYQGPPFRLGYYGLGEPICFVTWIISVTAAYYSQLAAYPPFARHVLLTYPHLLSRLYYVFANLFFSRHHFLLAAAVLVAIPTALILLCSHFHQLEDDKRVGKRSPIVRLGTLRATMVLEASLAAFMLVHCILYGRGMMPAAPFYLSFLAIPHAVKLADFVRTNHHKPHAVKAAKYYAVRFHFVHGVLLSVGFWLSVPSNPVDW